MKKWNQLGIIDICRLLIWGLVCYLLSYMPYHMDVFFTSEYKDTYKLRQVLSTCHLYWSTDLELPKVNILWKNEIHYWCPIELKLTSIDCLKPPDYFDITFIKVSVVFDFLEIFKDMWVDLEFHPLLIIYSMYSVKSGLGSVYTIHTLQLLATV